MCRQFLIGILISILATACGGAEESKDEKKLQLDKKTTLPMVDGSAFLVTGTPSDMKRMDANFENKAMLLGYTVNADAAAPGQVITVNWFWKSLKAIDGSWEYFTHLLDEDGMLVKSVNSEGPMRSKYKPHMWKPGEIMKDSERITIPADWDSKSMELRTGLWQGPERMRVIKGPVDDENRARGPVISISANAPQPVAPSSATLDVPFTAKAPKIDGKIDDAQWADAAGLTRFVSTLNGRPVRGNTDVKLLWGEQYLYVAMTADDNELISPYTNPDDDVWMADALDIFLQPMLDGPYYELQISPNGIVFDAHYVEYRKADVSWTSNAQVAVSVKGTVNDTAEPTDTGWTLEAAIPMANILPGDLADSAIRANFFRVDKMSQMTEYSAWSAPMRGDFHAQDRFGRLNLKK
ncbi:MAG: carbohydrate-binding family 9-like protein [Deltaproteobacteria bacterium]|nr:carbohydrate-binding family 9-like protein [Deltaproteobacteria bacterium]